MRNISAALDHAVYIFHIIAFEMEYFIDFQYRYMLLVISWMYCEYFRAKILDRYYFHFLLIWFHCSEQLSLNDRHVCLFYLSPTIYETINMCNTVTVQACRRTDACSFVRWFVCLFIRCVSIFTKFCCWSLLPLLVINGM